VHILIHGIVYGERRNVSVDNIMLMYTM
jgi:hypothetical protein